MFDSQVNMSAWASKSSGIDIKGKAGVAAEAGLERLKKHNKSWLRTMSFVKDIDFILNILIVYSELY